MIESPSLLRMFPLHSQSSSKGAQDASDLTGAGELRNTQRKKSTFTRSIGSSEMLAVIVSSDVVPGSVRSGVGRFERRALGGSWLVVDLRGEGGLGVI